MNWWQIAITVFVVGGIVYNFAESAEENGLDFWGGIGKLLKFIVYLPLLPFFMLFDKPDIKKLKK